MCAELERMIYYRFAQGLTKDPRFGAFIFAVRLLGDQARSSLERSV